MTSNPYDNEFFESALAGSLLSARKVLPKLFEFFKPRSAVDVGCGEGAWLLAAKENGVEELLGLDGDYVDRTRLFVRPDQFRPWNLKERILISRRFDLAIALEVAEHLPYERSETFVDDLCRLSDVILFSAAMPYQGGTDHINEQWLEFWAILFRRHNYVPYDLLRGRIWSDAGIEFWYQQNLVVFAEEKQGRNLFPSKYLVHDGALSYPHPLTFLLNASRWRPILPSILEHEFNDYRALLAAYVGGKRELPDLETLNVRVDRNGCEIAAFPVSRTLIEDPASDLRIRDSKIAQQTEEIKGLIQNASELRSVNESYKVELERRSAVIEELQTYIKARDVEMDRRQHVIEELRSYLDDRNVEMDRRQHVIEEFRSYLDELRSYLQDRNAEMDRRQQVIDELRSYLVDRNVEMDRRQHVIEELRSYLDDRNAELQRRADEIDRLRSSIESNDAQMKIQVIQLIDVTSQRDSVSLENKDLLKKLDELERKLAAQHRDLESVTRECARLQEMNQAIFSSTSWKMTRPIRFMGKFLRAVSHRNR
jgi:hypothetical protein